MEKQNNEGQIEYGKFPEDSVFTEEARKDKMMKELSLLSNEAIIAAIYHQANKFWHAANGNLEIKDWYLLEQYEKKLIIDSVRKAMCDNRDKIDSIKYLRYSYHEHNSYVKQVERKLLYAIVDVLK